MAALTQGQIDEVKDSLKLILGEDNENSEMVMMLVQALGTDEDTFGIVAPGIMQSLQQALNNPNDKLALVQALNATGHKAEDLTNDVMAFMGEVDKINSLSAQKKDFIKDFFAAYVNAINDTEGIAKRNVPVAIELCHPDAKIPQYAHISDSGADVYALEDITVHPGETVLVSTGLKVALLPGFELQVRPKSGRALKTKLRVANTPGTIDQTYRDEIKIIIENVEPPIKDITVDGDGKVTSILYGSDFVIGKGEKFCQLVLNEVPKASFYRVDSVLEIDKDDRNGGFGSSGLV
jgi:dUTP pyrophosphatase